MTHDHLARYRGQSVELTTGPRGARVPKATIERLLSTFATTPRMIEVAPRIWNLVGIGICSRAMIDAPEGLIIFDTGDDLEDGERALAEFRKVSTRPIKAIVYSHNHYAHGTQPFLRDSPDAIVIGHHEVNHHLTEIASGFASGGEFPEAVPALTARYLQQFASLLPPDGPDTGFAATIPQLKPKGTVLATHLVREGDEMMVAGLKMKFFTEHFSDSEDTLTAWVPELGFVYNNFLWPSLFNFYTLRGDVFRDPRSWRQGLQVIRDLEPEVLVNTHALPTTGRAEVKRVLEHYMDAISFMIDQTLRGINRGLSPDGLKRFVQLPPHLRDFPHNGETYSEFFYFPPHLYHHVFGWYDGNPASIHRLPEDEEAQRIVAGFGGPERVLAQQREAFAAGDLLWASRLAGWLLATDPAHSAYRQAQADALRQIAYRSPGTIARHFCLARALELEGQIQVPVAVLPEPAAVLSVEPARYIDFQRIRLVPERSLDVDRRVVIEIDDKGVRHALHVRRGVCEFVREPGPLRAADLSLKLSHEAWADFYLGLKTLESLLGEGRALVGDRAAVVEFFDLFDTPHEACGGISA